MSTALQTTLRPATATIQGFDYIEFYVGNVRHSVHYYESVWGFTAQEPSDLQTPGVPSQDRTTVGLRQGTARLLLTGATRSSSPVAEHLRVHGEGVARIAFRVGDAETAFQTALDAGATPLSSPSVIDGGQGPVRQAEVRAPGGVSHVFVERRSNDQGASAGTSTSRPNARIRRPLLTGLDHLAMAVEAGTLDAWVEFYQRAFGFVMTHREDVATELSGMNSRVVQHPSGECKLPIVEPAAGPRKSQIQEFLDAHNGPGVQHVAFSTTDIVKSVSQLKRRGVEFLSVPVSYYEELESRVGNLGDEIRAFQEQNILVDHDEWGYLLQTFARPCQDRSTFFVEVVERRGAHGFGGGNIRALFQAIEREQRRRGTL